MPGAVANSRAEIISMAHSICNDDIPQEMINEICGNGFLHRLQQCIRAEGHSSESLRHLERTRDSIGELPVFVLPNEEE